MEIRAEVKATYKEISEYFHFDEVLNIRYYEKKGDEDLYKTIIRIPECDIKNTNQPITLGRLKQKVVKKCVDSFPIHSKVIFANGSSRMIYASSLYWEAEYAKTYAEHFKTKVVHIERISGGNGMEELLYTPKLPKGFEQEDFNVEEWLSMAEETEKKVRELDRKAKESGSILYRFLYEPVADGKGIYQIIKVNKKTCRIRYCSTDGYNEYQVRQWGEIATVPMQYVLDALGRQDYLDNLHKKKEPGQP